MLGVENVSQIGFNVSQQLATVFLFRALSMLHLKQLFAEGAQFSFSGDPELAGHHVQQTLVDGPAIPEDSRDWCSAVGTRNHLVQLPRHLLWRSPPQIRIKLVVIRKLHQTV